MGKKNKNVEPPAPIAPAPPPFTMFGPGDPTSLLGQGIREAQNNIRGGYAARGLAGSGIAQAGENNAIGSLILQDMQRQTGNLTNFIAAGSGQQSNSSSGGGGITVICSEMHRQGWIDDETFAADCKFGMTLPSDVYIGYMIWARHVAGWMAKSRVVTWMVVPLGLAWTRHMTGRPSVVGWLLMKLGWPICRALGRRVTNEYNIGAVSCPR